MLITGCTTALISTAAIDVRVICKAFPPIKYSRRDTDETQRQIVGYNAARDALCAGIEK